MGFLSGPGIKNPPACQCRRHRRQVQSLDWEDPLAEKMTTHYSILAWRIPWTEKPCLLESMRFQRFLYDRVTEHARTRDRFVLIL